MLHTYIVGCRRHRDTVIYNRLHTWDGCMLGEQLTASLYKTEMQYTARSHTCTACHSSINPCMALYRLWPPYPELVYKDEDMTSGLVAY